MCYSEPSEAPSRSTIGPHPLPPTPRPRVVSGSKEESPTAPDETVEPQAAVEARGGETQSAEDGTTGAEGAGAEAEVEMTAAEALAQATRAADGETQDEAPAPEAAPEQRAEAESREAALSDAAAEAARATDTDAAEVAAVEAQPEPVAAAETKPAAEPEPAGVTAEAKPATEPEPTDDTAEAKATEEAAKPEAAKPKPAPKPIDRPELRAVREAIANRESLEGRVIGWNNGGFHLALGELSAFCPRSEMELGEIEEPESYLDRTFLFRVLRLQGKGRRIVVSRAAHLRNELSRQRGELRKKLQVGAVLDGTVASLKDFGAFVELGGSQGLVHVSEISHRRVEHPSDVLSEGQQVQVKVLKVEQGGRRISLSIRALEPDPWKDLADRFPQGAVVKGKVEKANQIGAFIELAPGLTGLLPAKSMSIPRETTPARAYPPGKEVSVQIVSIDPRRQRISLALEGSGLEGSRNDYKEYQRQTSAAGSSGGFNALASAFRRIRGDAD